MIICMNTKYYDDNHQSTLGRAIYFRGLRHLWNDTNFRPPVYPGTRMKYMVLCVWPCYSTKQSLKLIMHVFSTTINWKLLFSISQFRKICKNNRNLTCVYTKLPLIYESWSLLPLSLRSPLTKSEVQFVNAKWQIAPYISALTVFARCRISICSRGKKSICILMRFLSYWFLAQ